MANAFRKGSHWAFPTSLPSPTKELHVKFLSPNNAEKEKGAWNILSSFFENEDNNVEDLYISSFKDLYAASLLRNNEEIVTSLVFGKVEEAIIIILLVTQPNYRNRGCAEFLLELVKDEHKYSCLYTQVKNDNMAAKQFYQKVGFVQNNGLPPSEDSSLWTVSETLTSFSFGHRIRRHAFHQFFQAHNLHGNLLGDLFFYRPGLPPVVAQEVGPFSPTVRDAKIGNYPLTSLGETSTTPTITPTIQETCGIGISPALLAIAHRPGVIRDDKIYRLCHNVRPLVNTRQMTALIVKKTLSPDNASQSLFATYAGENDFRSDDFLHKMTFAPYQITQENGTAGTAALKVADCPEYDVINIGAKALDVDSINALISKFGVDGAPREGTLIQRLHYVLQAISYQYGSFNCKKDLQDFVVDLWSMVRGDIAQDQVVNLDCWTDVGDMAFLANVMWAGLNFPCLAPVAGQRRMYSASHVLKGISPPMMDNPYSANNHSLKKNNHMPPWLSNNKGVTGLVTTGETLNVCELRLYSATLQSWSDLSMQCSVVDVLLNFKEESGSENSFDKLSINKINHVLTYTQYLEMKYIWFSKLGEHLEKHRRVNVGINTIFSAHETKNGGEVCIRGVNGSSPNASKFFWLLHRGLNITIEGVKSPHRSLFDLLWMNGTSFRAWDNTPDPLFVQKEGQKEISLWPNNEQLPGVGMCWTLAFHAKFLNPIAQMLVHGLMASWGDDTANVGKKFVNDILLTWVHSFLYEILEWSGANVPVPKSVEAYPALAKLLEPRNICSDIEDMSKHRAELFTNLDGVIYLVIILLSARGGRYTLATTFQDCAGIHSSRGIKMDDFKKFCPLVCTRSVDGKSISLMGMLRSVLDDLKLMDEKPEFKCAIARANLFLGQRQQGPLQLHHALFTKGERKACVNRIVQSTIRSIYPKVLLLGFCYHNGFSDYRDVVKNSQFCRSNQQVARDLVRILAIEESCLVDIYTVSRSTVDSMREDRHLQADYCKEGFVDSVETKWQPEGWCFSKVILDYCWMPNSYMAGGGYKAFLGTIVPQFVERDILAKGGIVFLPKNIEICMHLVSAVRSLQTSYQIRFVKPSEENSLWFVTSQIIPPETTAILGKEPNQEDIYCHFKIDDLAKFAIPSHVCLQMVTEILNRVTDWNEARFCRLEYLPDEVEDRGFGGLGEQKKKGQQKKQTPQRNRPLASKRSPIPQHLGEQKKQGQKKKQTAPSRKRSPSQTPNCPRNKERHTRRREGGDPNDDKVHQNTSQVASDPNDKLHKNTSQVASNLGLLSDTAAQQTTKHRCFQLGQNSSYACVKDKKAMVLNHYSQAHDFNLVKEQVIVCDFVPVKVLSVMMEAFGTEICKESFQEHCHQIKNPTNDTTLGQYWIFTSSTAIDGGEEANVYKDWNKNPALTGMQIGAITKLVGSIQASLKVILLNHVPLDDVHPGLVCTCEVGHQLVHQDTTVKGSSVTNMAYVLHMPLHPSGIILRLESSPRSPQENHVSYVYIPFG